MLKNKTGNRVYITGFRWKGTDSTANLVNGRVIIDRATFMPCIAFEVWEMDEKYEVGRTSFVYE